MQWGDHHDLPEHADIHRVRARLTRALSMIEEAIALTDGRVTPPGKPPLVALEGLRDDLLIVLWLIEIAISDH
jgi:hypothetical protein